MNDLLLDTHTLLWFLNGDEQLSHNSRDAIINPLNRKYVSIASVWEITIKISLKRLDFDGNTAEILKLIDDNGFDLLLVLPKHILALESLPYYHRDPFDRILIASAISENMKIVSVDEKFHFYNGIEIIW